MQGRVWIAIGAMGCAHTGGWQIHHGTLQSISGPQSFATLHADGPPRAWQRVVECAADGLQLGVGGRFTDAGARLQFDDAPPLTLPTRVSRRGIPVVDLRAPIPQRSTTPEALLAASSQVTVLPVPPETGTEAVSFATARADRAIAALHCPGARPAEVSDRRGARAK